MVSGKWRIRKLKNRWWLIRPTWMPQSWVAQYVGTTWEEAMTHIPTSENGPQSDWKNRVDDYVERSYGSVMPPWQRDLVKRLARGDEATITARPFIYTLCKRTAAEVVAVLNP
jgi:hypothetical protein